MRNSGLYCIIALTWRIYNSLISRCSQPKAEAPSIMAALIGKIIEGPKWEDIMPASATEKG